MMAAGNKMNLAIMPKKERNPIHTGLVDPPERDEKEGMDKSRSMPKMMSAHFRANLNVLVFISIKLIGEKVESLLSKKAQILLKM